MGETSKKNVRSRRVKTIAAVIVLLWALAPGGQTTGSSLTPDVANSRGLAFIEQKSYGKAKQCFAMAVQAMPDNKFYNNNLAVACINLGDYREAKKHLKKALRLDPRYAKALSNMAVTCFYLFQFNEAYNYYRLARSADPNYAKTRFEKQRVIQKLERMNRIHPGNHELEALVNYLKETEIPVQ